jgi:tRNA pseudouridine13 synthase
MYQIKQISEDFVVKEISNIKFLDKGSHVYFGLKKKNWNTLDVVKEISKRLGIFIKNIGFAGSKDKKAITEQLISVKSVKKERVERLQIKDTSLEFLGYGNEPITLGDLEGNYFEIVVRNLDSFDIEKPKRVVNYFGEQRFSKNNVEVGRSLVKKDFKKACEVLQLEAIRNDYIGALKTIPKRLLRLYVNAYQSFIWNSVVSELIKDKIEIKEIPLIGFGTELNNYDEKIKKIINKILKKENLGLNDFIIKQIPELSLEGELRKVFVEVKDFKVLEKEKDELNEGKKKIKISFSLSKGSYATVVVKELFDKLYIV